MTGQPPTPLTEPLPIFETPGLALWNTPLELLGLFAPPAEAGPITLTPSIAISEEYNDNIFLNNQDRKTDFITTLSPALILTVNRRSFRLLGGYTFSGQLYARESRLNDPVSQQNFLASGSYRFIRGLTLTATDSYVVSHDTSLVGSQGFTTGRQQSWSNAFQPTMAWHMTPESTLELAALYSVLRPEGRGAARASDTYDLRSSLRHIVTRRLTAMIGYSFVYLDFKTQESSVTHTPIVGASYRLTQTLTGTITGGPAITELGGRTFVTPAGSASLVQTFKGGFAGVTYTRGVSAAGAFGGTTDMQSASGLLALPTLRRGLLIVFSPTYTTATSVSTRQTGQVDARTLTLNLAAMYRIARSVTVFGGYTFLQQRTGGSSSQQLDAEQDRVRFGVQFGYPFNFD